MAADDVVVEPGDMLLLHTGFATKVLEWRTDPDPVKIHTHVLLPRRPGRVPAGVDRRVADLGPGGRQLRRRGALGRDRDQSRHSFLPIHHLCLFRLGVPLGEMWYLHDLAGWLRQHQPSRFLLTAPPLRLPGSGGLAADPGGHRVT